VSVRFEKGRLAEEHPISIRTEGMVKEPGAIQVEVGMAAQDNASPGQERHTISIPIRVLNRGKE